MSKPPKKDTEFKRFAAKRIIIGVIIAVAVLWTLGGLMGIIERPEPIPNSTLSSTAHEEAAPGEAGDHGHAPVATKTVAAKAASHAQKDAHADTSTAAAHGGAHDEARTGGGGHAADEDHAKAAAGRVDEYEGAAPAAHDAAPEHDEASQEETAHGEAAPGKGHESAVSEAIAPKLPERKERGVATVEAMIAPLEFELEERFWGWRPNDLINFTDNVNNFQLGVLEVTRRAAVALTERISRTGTTDAFNPDLENATNWFMIKATKYWFPSAENKYREGIEDLKKYRDALQAKRATFYTRTDNLIPLLASFEDLLGSCDENLVKHMEDDGSEVSLFKADNYFFYARGVAASMAPILEAIHHDFLITLETRHGTELLHHALESCHAAAALDPWLITDSELDGILANHRANMAAPISHARFYLGALIKALST
jgi:hypothetical protein